MQQKRFKSAYRHITGGEAKQDRRPRDELAPYFADLASAAGDERTHRDYIGAAMAVAMDNLWYSSCRPFYRVYPAIAAALCKFRLEDFADDKFVSPFPALAVEPVSDDYCATLVMTDRTGDKLALVCCVYADMLDNGVFPHSFPYHLYFHDPKKSIAESLGGAAGELDEAASASGIQIQQEAKEKWIRSIKLSLAVCLLAHDPAIITPALSAENMRKLEQLKTDKEREEFTEKRFLKMGQRGWCIGAQYEVTPHTRRPHLAIVWKGKGRTQREIVLRKGAIVKRRKVTDVPTGFRVGED